MKTIGEAINSWNRLFEWTAKKCDDKAEAKKICFLLIKILKPLKEHPDYDKIDYVAVHTEFMKEIEKFTEVYLQKQV
jgi:hypothetical protein